MWIFQFLPLSVVTVFYKINVDQFVVFAQFECGEEEVIFRELSPSVYCALILKTIWPKTNSIKPHEEF